MRWTVTWLYAGAIVPLVLASHAAASVAFVIYDRLPTSIQRSDWIGYALNDLAPGLAGVGCALVLLAILARLRRFSVTVLGFLWRTAPWWLLAAAIQAVVLRERSNPDFGLWSQVITWPLAALVAGLATDALWTWRRRSVSRAV